MVLKCDRHPQYYAARHNLIMLIGKCHLVLQSTFVSTTVTSTTFKVRSCSILFQITFKSHKLCAATVLYHLPSCARVNFSMLGDCLSSTTILGVQKSFHHKIFISCTPRKSKGSTQFHEYEQPVTLGTYPGFKATKHWQKGAGERAERHSAETLAL